jgi:3D (Asp-Asp-Asp) domain-containing protein
MPKTRPVAVSRAIAVVATGAALAWAAYRLSHAPFPVAREVAVLATAYNSSASQTEGDPYVTASGARLAPGMRAIAISRDLFDLGLAYGQTVTIEGLDGGFVVLDTTARRWKRRIDIYMGDDVRAARRWGRREVVIRWNVPSG